jgi:hypothetical protein
MSIARIAAGVLGHIRTIDPHKSPKFNAQYHVMTSKDRNSLAEICKDQVKFVHAGFLNLFGRT